MDFIRVSSLKRRAFFQNAVEIHPQKVHLVGGLNPSEKYEFVNWNYYPQHRENNPVMFQSPPVRYTYILYIHTITIKHY